MVIKMTSVKERTILEIMSKKLDIAMEQKQIVEFYQTPYLNLIARGKIIDIYNINEDDYYGSVISVDTEDHYIIKENRVALNEFFDMYENYSDKINTTKISLIQLEDKLIKSIMGKEKKLLKVFGKDVMRELRNVLMRMKNFSLDLTADVYQIHELLSVISKTRSKSSIITFFTDFSDIIMEFEYSKETTDLT